MTTANLTNKELLDLYAIAVTKYHKSDMDDPDADEIELECTRLEGIGAKRSRGVFAAMERIMNEVTMET